MSKEILGQVITKLRGARYCALRERFAEARRDQEEATALVYAHCGGAVPAVSLLHLAVSCLSPYEANLYLVEYERLHAEIDALVNRKDDPMDPLAELTGAKLLRLALEKILDENNLTYRDVEAVDAEWVDGDTLDLDFLVAITRTVTVTSA